MKKTKFILRKWAWKSMAWWETPLPSGGPEIHSSFMIYEQISMWIIQKMSLCKTLDVQINGLDFWLSHSLELWAGLSVWLTNGRSFNSNVIKYGVGYCRNTVILRREVYWWRIFVTFLLLLNIMRCSNV